MLNSQRCFCGCSSLLEKMKPSHTQRTIDAYNKNAEKYACKFDNYEIYHHKISDFQQKYIAEGAHIIDVGCGPGNNIRTIVEQDPTCSFTGIDLSKEFIDISRKRFSTFSFLQQDIRNLDVDSKFQVVLASFCIVHLTDQETTDFINNLNSIMANNGYLYLSYMNGEKAGFESTSFSDESIFFNYFQDTFILDLLAQSSLDVLEISKEEYIEPDGCVTIDTFIYAQNTR